jgi:hypothetical protein
MIPSRCAVYRNFLDSNHENQAARLGIAYAVSNYWTVLRLPTRTMSCLGKEL